MRCDSLTELGHAYWKRSSNAKHLHQNPPRSLNSGESGYLSASEVLGEGKVMREGLLYYHDFHEIRIFYYQFKIEMVLLKL